MRRTLILASVLALAACGAPPQMPQMPPPEVGVASPIARELPATRLLTGRIEPIDILEISPKVGGTVSRVLARSGALVEPGQALFELDPAPFQAAVARASAVVAEAEARLRQAVDARERNQRLLADKLVSQQVHDDSVNQAQAAEAALAAARAALGTAQLELDWTTVRAPIAGRLGLLSIAVGSQVQGGGAMPPSVITSLITVDPVYVGFDLDEASYHRLAPRLAASVRGEQPMTVRVGVSGQDGLPYSGRVVFTDNHIDPTAGTMRVRALIRGAEGALTAGAYARVSLETEPARPVLLVHEQAILAQLATRYVLTVGEQGVTAFRPVQVGQAHGEMREVSGLAPNDVIVATNLAKVFFPGMPVAGKPVDMETLQAK
jgi:RND family efflux transporter MFP subunit